MPRFHKHIFICENLRTEDHVKGSCARKGSSELKEYFKQRIKQLGLSAKFRVNTAGCLDACGHGPVIVIYPEQIWYGGVTKDDIEEIIQSHIINDIPVDRLLIRDKKFIQDAE